MKLIPVSLVGLLLSGCASNQSLYQWGAYDAMLYQSYKSPDKSDDFRVGLESHLMLMEQSKKKIAPGLYAELGTLYLQAGNRDKALSFYAKERDIWPESKLLMDALTKNIDKPKALKPESKS